MSAVLKSWLEGRLGVIYDMRPEYFGVHVSDGTVLAKLLLSYNIIHYHLFRDINETQNQEAKLNNFRLLKVWIDFIGVKADDNTLKELSMGNGNVAIAFFYQLFFCLEGKDCLHFMAQEAKKDNLAVSSSRFHVEKVDESPSEASSLIAEEELQKIPSTKLQMLQKFEEQYKRILEQSKPAPRRPPVTDPAHKKCAEMPMTSLWTKKKLTMSKRPNFEKYESAEMKISRAISYPRSQPKSRRQQSKELAYNTFKGKMKQIVLQELWETLLREQEKRFDEMVLEKLIKQSQYEKKMTTKLFHVRDQKKVMIQNRLIIEKMLDDKIIEEADKEHIRDREDEEIEETKISLEEKRRRELQTRIDEEKRKLQYERHYETSQKVVEALVDFGARAAEYKKLTDGPVPQKLWDEWKALYLKGLPIFDVLEDPACLIDEAFIDDLATEVQEEAERQAVLNEHDLMEYLHETGPWSKDAIELDPSIPSESLYVLGYIVHRLLAMKYPFPPGPTHVILPNYPVAAILIGEFDEISINTLKSLLAFRSIQIVTMENVINTCLECYSNESTPKLIEKNLEKDVKFDSPKKKSSKKSKKGTSVTSEGEGVSPQLPLPIDKSTQTTSLDSIKNEEPLIVSLSPIATLGQSAFLILSEGNELPDDLLVDMIGEYLLTLKDVNGWILLNYPLSYSQAALIEEKLSGLKMPRDCSEEESPEIIMCKKQRSSLLVPKPEECDDPEHFKTYFTAYVNTKSRDQQADSDSRESDEYVEEEMTFLEQLYTEQGMNYTFYYQCFNFTTLKKLARILIGDMEMPFKSSVELFGEIGIENEDSDKPVKESASPQKGAKGHEAGIDKHGPVINVQASSADTITSLQTRKSKTIGESEVAETKIPSAEAIVPKPGEAGFPYASFDQPLEIRQALASLWEIIEQTYLRSFKQIFFSKRIYYSHIVPYINYVTKFVREYIMRPDRKQEVVHEFQIRFNEMEADLREDVEIKCELHCRVSELRHALWNMCDVRKNESESERCSIILESWVAVEMVSLTNLFITAMQIECDRCVDTMQMICDYYLSMVSVFPSEKLKEKINLTRMSQNDGSWDNLINNFSEEKIRSKMSAMSLTSNSIKSVIAKILIHCHEISPFVTPCHMTIQEVQKKALAFIDSIESSSKDTYTKLRIAMMKESSKGGKSVKKGKGVSRSTIPEEESPLVKARLNLFEEWACCVTEEANRARYRLELLKTKAWKDLSELLHHVHKMFIILYDDISNRYTKEIESVDALCDYICTAIEDEVPIQEQLVLERDTFVVRSNVLMFPPPPTPPPAPTEERNLPFEFRISQLIKLQEKLLFSAPSGSIPEAAFVFFLEDLIVGGSWDGEERLLPYGWYDFGHTEIQTILDHLYGGLEYVDWVDFILSAADLPYPTQSELLAVRRKYRAIDFNNDETVFQDDFYEVKLWFEEAEIEDPQTELRLERAKILLFRIFKVGNFRVNYTKLLLSFCKDDDPKKGFLKALALSTGKYIVLDSEGVSEEDLLTDDELIARLELAKKAKEMAGGLIEDLLEEAIQTTEGLIIKEVQDEDSDEIELGIEEDKISGTHHPSTSSAMFLAQEPFIQAEDVDESPLISESAVPKDQIWISFIPFEVALIVLVSAVPWLSKQPHLREGLPSLRACLEEMYEGNKSIQVSQLLDHKAMDTILSCTNKFRAVTLASILDTILPKGASGSLLADDDSQNDFSLKSINGVNN